MAKAGIVIDSWKYWIFERHLSTNGYVFSYLAGPAPKTMSLFVQTENLEALIIVVTNANAEAARTRKHA